MNMNINRFDAMVVQARDRAKAAKALACECQPQAPRVAEQLAAYAAGCGPRGQGYFGRKAAPCPIASWPTVIADKCLDVRIKPSQPFQVPPWVLAEYLSAMTRASAGDPLTGSAAIAGGLANIVLSEAASLSRRVGAFIVELSSGTTTGPADATFTVDVTFEDGSTAVLGPYRIQTNGAVRGRAIIFPYRRASAGAAVIYPMLVQMQTAKQVAVAPANAFGVNIPVAAVPLNSQDIDATLNCTAGTNGATITLQTLSVNDDIFGEVESYLMACGARAEAA